MTPTPVRHCSIRPGMSYLLKAAVCAIVSLGFQTPANADDFGLINKDGKVLAEPIYARITRTADGWYLVQPHYLDKDKNHEPFLVNSNGQRKPASEEYRADSANKKTVAPKQQRPQNVPMLLSCTFRGDAMYEIANSAGERGFCDTDGKILVPLSQCSSLTYVGSDRFIRESYSVSGSKKTELVASGGKVLSIIPQTIHLESHPYCDGLLRARSYGQDSVSICYLDASGALAIEPGRFASGRDFHNGRAVVELLKGGSKTAAYIDTSGAIVAGPFFGAGDFWYKKFALVSVDEQHTGMIDLSGKFLIEPLYTVLELQGDRLAAVKDGRWMLLSTTGKLELKLPTRVTYLDARSKDGLWIFGEGGSASDDVDILDEDNNEVARKKLGLMNSAGKTVLNAKFNDIENLGDGLARIAMTKGSKHEQRWGIANELGKIVIPCRFSEITKTGDVFIVRNRTPGGFSPDEWKRLGREPSMNRQDLWRKFLNDYDVIGMDRDDVYKLLGGSRDYNKTEISHFFLNSGGFCGNMGRSVEIRFDKSTDKVTGWREREGGLIVPKDYGWLTENFIYKCLDPERAYSRIYDIVPKLRDSSTAKIKPIRSCF